jgi:hypothetical protein
MIRQSAAALSAPEAQVLHQHIAASAGDDREQIGGRLIVTRLAPTNTAR